MSKDSVDAGELGEKFRKIFSSGTDVMPANEKAAYKKAVGEDEPAKKEEPKDPQFKQKTGPMKPSDRQQMPKGTKGVVPYKKSARDYGD